MGGAGGSFGNMEAYFDEVIVTDNSGENQVGYIMYPLQGFVQAFMRTSTFRTMG